MPELLFPENGTVVNTYTPVQEEFLERVCEQEIDDTLAWLLPVKNGRECSFPKPIVFQWSDCGSDVYIFELSKAPDFCFSYTGIVTKPSCLFTNLEIGKTYYWRVNRSKPFSFTTAHKGYRFLQVDGLLNVRDLGGIGIRQGLLYRGSDLEGEYQITPAGQESLCSLLQIRTELDLRKEKPARGGCSAADESIRYVRLPYRPYKECFEDEHRQGICRIMEFLADANNYPIYFHCLGGADRTGMIALFLRALAGETDEQILVDYELTSLSAYAGGLAEGAAANGFRSRNSDYFVEFLQELNRYAPGKSLSVKVPLFLYDCGVTKENVEKARSILKSGEVTG